MINIRNLDFRFYAVISLLVLWASTTFSIALTEIAFVCALICWLVWHVQAREGLCHITVKGTGTFFSKAGKGACPPIDWALWAPLVLFLALVLASYFTSEYPKQSFRGLLKIAKPVTVFFIAAGLFRNPKDQKWFNGIFLATFLMIAIDSSIQYAFGNDLIRGFAAEDSKSGLRLVGPFGNFAKMATYLVLVIPIFGMRFLSKFSQSVQRKASFYTLALALSGGLLLYLTRCRGAMLGLAFSFLLIFVYKRWFKALGIALLLCLALLAVMPKTMIFHYDISYKEQSLRERISLWRRALDVIEAKPWTGTGINTYNVAHAKYDKEQNWRVRGYYAHNGYLQLAAEIGLPGIFCFLWFLFMFSRRSLQAVARVRGSPEEYIQLGLLTGLLAFLIYATADNNLQSPPSLMMFWYLTGVLRARQLAARQEITPSTPGDQNQTPGVNNTGTVPE